MKKKMKRKPKKPRSDVAKALGCGAFKQRIVRSKKSYTRKGRSNERPFRLSNRFPSTISL